MPKQQSEGTRMAEAKPSVGAGEEIVVPSRLVNPHPVVAQARAHYEKAGHADDRRGDPHRPRVLELRVSPASLHRALRLADALFKAAEARGHKMMLKPGDYGGACVVVGDQPVRVSLEERFERVPHEITKAEQAARKRNPYVLIPTHDARPTGELTFLVQNVASARGRWSEGERWKQEDRIGAVLAGIEAAAIKLRAERLEWERREREWQAAEERRQREQEWREKLDRHLAGWRLARDIRALVAELRQVVAMADGAESDGDLDAWLSWALRYADRIDPVAALRGSLQAQSKPGEQG